MIKRYEANRLSSSDMKNIKGGREEVPGSCSVICNGIAGSWTGYYGSLGSLTESINGHCGGYGAAYSCQGLQS